MKKFILFLLFVSLFIFSIGCMDISRDIVVNDDGSGIITVRTLYTKQFLSMMDSLNKNKKVNSTTTPMIEQLTDKDKLKEEGQKMGSGVKLKSVDPLNLEDGSQGYNAVYTFPDINKIKIGENPPSPVKNKKQSAPKKKPKQPITFKFKKGETNTLIINMPPPEKQKEQKPAAAKKPKGMNKMMIQMFKGFKIEITISVNGKIKKTNASHVKGNKITLLMMDIGKIVSDPKLLKKFEELGKIDDISIIQQKMKNIPYIKAQKRRKILVKFK